MSFLCRLFDIAHIYMDRDLIFMVLLVCIVHRKSDRIENIYKDIFTITINNGTSMKTNKLPQSASSDSQEAGSQSLWTSHSSSRRLQGDHTQQTGYASNDASYNHGDNDLDTDSLDNDNGLNNHDQLDTGATHRTLQDGYMSYKSQTTSTESTTVSHKDIGSNDGSVNTKSNRKNSYDDDYQVNGYKKPQKLSAQEPLMSAFLHDQNDTVPQHPEQQRAHSEDKKDYSEHSHRSSMTNYPSKEIPERVFMNGLIKHTGIALAIIIPLAAFSAYAATPPMAAASVSDVDDETPVEMLLVAPSDVIHKSANSPTTVDKVNLKKYAGTWYEIGRLPMYFQRNCARDVTATYTEKTDGSGIIVTNKCVDKEGSSIVAEGLAKPVNDTGSKLKVTFLPSWIRWLPVGRADYWVLARDADYKTALVGTPDKDYLWLLARSPNISQETYAKYRQIAQQQGYDLKEFNLTPQTNQTVSLVP